LGRASSGGDLTGDDAVGNLTSKTDRKGQTISYTFDQLNRLIQKSYPDSTTVAYAFDKDSRLTQAVDPTGTYGFTYDRMGRLTQTSTAPIGAYGVDTGVQP
jgi:YD repeat-containing protein